MRFKRYHHNTAMKQTLKKSDSILYSPFCFLSHLFSKFCHFLGIAHPADPRTLIIRPGGMGDLVLVDLALQNLDIPLTQCFFVIETRSEPWALYRGMNYICYDRQLFKTVMTVINKFFTVINTEQLFGLSQALANIAVTTSGKKFGFHTNRSSNYLTHVIPYDALNEHELSSFERILGEAFGKKPLSKKEFNTHSRSKTFWVHIAGTNIPERLVSVEKWCELAALEIKSDTFDKIKIGYSATDELFAQSLKLSLEKTISLPIELFGGDFNSLCQELKSAKRVFTADSGVVHLCSFFQTPVTAIFTSGRSSKWAPLSTHSAHILKKDLACRPCTLFWTNTSLSEFTRLS